MKSNWFDYTIYGKGKRARAGLTFKPTPSLTLVELWTIITELQSVALELEDKR